MRPSYSLYSWFIDGISSESAVYSLDKILRKHGATLNQDCVLLLNDDDGDAPASDYIDDPELALAQLVAWPSHGSIEYDLGDVFLVTTFHSEEGSPVGRIHCIRLSMPSDWFDDHRPISEQRLGSIAGDLHSTMMANRTVMGWSGPAPRVYWSDELQRLRTGIVEGEYDVDLR